MSKAKKTSGFTLVEIMIVVLIIGIITSIAVPGYMQARESSRRSSCISNLKYIDSRKETYAMEAKLDNGDTVTWANLVPTYLKSQPACPGSGTYTIDVIGTNPTCSSASLGHVIP
ncbi:MAG: type pilus assembly protein PilA [Fimbriimonadaceae bacterium]|jgi:prepilin-type N-terminal cleavage/methylation domain-containing protein|nr:type pilus assembly protein PilA [Fimbriimonadaceae bacterium]